jgi:hypothetical protein
MIPAKLGMRHPPAGLPIARCPWMTALAQRIGYARAAIVALRIAMNLVYQGHKLLVFSLPAALSSA